ncbi:hypothetical protein [Microbacterium dextranolyticum]|uniref:hypothetical protein n=1 Tax=Microbacterium dextranolyticum TaxID=36806 RepID=UPI001DC92578|nr:hypothetical protein [Microbacterium dextranolyticum]MBM7461791.1 hypothetical protein [Microbacterium dextranolyticum]
MSGLQPRDSRERPQNREMRIVFVLYLVLFLGGMGLMGYAATVPGLEGLVFVAGILLVSLAVALPIALSSFEHRGEHRGHVGN